MAQITQPRILAVALLVQLRGGIGGGFMCLVGFMTAEARTVSIIRVVLGAEALLRSPGPDQRAICGEVLVRHVPLRPPIERRIAGPRRWSADDRGSWKTPHDSTPPII